MDAVLRGARLGDTDAHPTLALVLAHGAGTYLAGRPRVLRCNVCDATRPWDKASAVVAHVSPQLMPTTQSRLRRCVVTTDVELLGRAKTALTHGMTAMEARRLYELSTDSDAPPLESLRRTLQAAGAMAAGPLKVLRHGVLPCVRCGPQCRTVFVDGNYNANCEAVPGGGQGDLGFPGGVVVNESVVAGAARAARAIPQLRQQFDCGGTVHRAATQNGERGGRFRKLHFTAALCAFCEHEVCVLMVPLMAGEQFYLQVVMVCFAVLLGALVVVIDVMCQVQRYAHLREHLVTWLDGVTAAMFGAGVRVRLRTRGDATTLPRFRVTFLGAGAVGDAEDGDDDAGAAAGTGAADAAPAVTPATPRDAAGVLPPAPPLPPAPAGAGGMMELYAHVAAHAAAAAHTASIGGAVNSWHVIAHAVGCQLRASLGLTPGGGAVGAAAERPFRAVTAQARLHRAAGQVTFLLGYDVFFAQQGARLNADAPYLLLRDVVRRLHAAAEAAEARAWHTAITDDEAYTYLEQAAAKAAADAAGTSARGARSAAARDATRAAAAAADAAVLQAAIHAAAGSDVAFAVHAVNTPAVSRVLLAHKALGAATTLAVASHLLVKLNKDASCMPGAAGEVGADAAIVDLVQDLRREAAAVAQMVAVVQVPADSSEAAVCHDNACARCCIPLQCPRARLMHMRAHAPRMCTQWRAVWTSAPRRRSCGRCARG